MRESQGEREPHLGEKEGESEQELGEESLDFTVKDARSEERGQAKKIFGEVGKSMSA